MIRIRPLAVCLLVLGLAAASRPPAARAEAPGPVNSTWQEQQACTFEIYLDERRLGTEEFRAYITHDTLITASSVSLTGLDATSKLPREKRTTFLQRADDYYPMMFQVFEGYADSTQSRAMNCIFSDTVAVIYRELVGTGGRGEAVGLPAGRLFLLEPGVYANMQTLAAAFLAGTQDTRRQPVLIPALSQVVDLYLTRGPREAVTVRGKRVDATRVEMTDKLTQFVAWVDDEGRMWRLEAPGQGLRVERAPEAAKSGARAPAKKTKPAAKPGAR